MKLSSRLVGWWGAVEWVCLLAIAPFLLFAAPTRAPLLLAIPLLWVLRRVLLGRFVPSTPVDVPVLILMVMAGVGFCVSPDPRWSQMKIDALLLGVGLLYATVDLLRPAGRMKWVPAGVIALSFAFLGLGLLGTRWVAKIPLLGAMTGGLPGGLAWLPEGETSFNPNVIGGALLLVLPFSLSLLLTGWADKSARRRWGWVAAEGLVAVLCLGLLFLTQARGAWLGFAVSLVALLVLAGGDLGRLGVGLLVVALPALALLSTAIGTPAAQGTVAAPGTVAAQGAAWGLIQAGAGSTRLLSTVTIGQRLEIWSRAQYAIADFPFTGPGLDAFQYVMPAMYPLFQSHAGRFIPHAHNEFLQVALDLGLPGLVAWLALYLATFSMLWSALRHGHGGLSRALALGGSGALIGHLAYSMTDSSVLDAKPNVVFWVIVGLSVVLYQASPSPQASLPREDGSVRTSHG